MCGICGTCDSDTDYRPAPAVLQSMMDAMRHRGPDGEGIFTDTNVGLGHRRLSIIDLAGGSQPMGNEDGTITIVFNGEIYNYLELRPDLERRGHRLASSSDTEVILHLYEDKGRQCVDPLNGMFVFAIWDRRQRQLLLARDRLGEKPLYYHFCNGRLIFASELKALLKHPDVAATVSLAALDDYLAYGYVPDDRCVIEGVKKLPPGCTLSWRDGRITVRRYWDVAFDEAPIRDEEAWVEELEHRVREAVRIRLRSDVPLGVFLSGGVDSSAIAALASQVAGTRVKTFSVGFQEADFDELHYARMVAQRYATEHREIIVRDHDISVLADLVYHLDEPFADPSALPTYYVCREASRHVTVCLSGDGGDELFAGYARYRQALNQHGWDRFIGPGAGQIGRLISHLVPRHFRGHGMLERLSERGPGRYSLQVGVFSARERRELLNAEMCPVVQDNGALFLPFFETAERRGLVTTLQLSDQKTYLPDDILVKVDRMSMQNSLEVRVPFLDHTLAEFVNHVSGDWKLRAGVSKYVLKKLLAPHLPAQILSRRKMGFGIPLKHWFRGRQDEFVGGLLCSGETRCTRWLSRKAIHRLLRDNQHHGRDLSQKLWALMVLEQWCRVFAV